MARGRWKKTAELLASAREILEAEQPMTIRQLFYRLVSIQIIENSLAGYKRVSRVLTDAREQGDISFDWIVDRSRPIYAPNVFDDPEDYLQVASKAYRRDYWQAQPVHVEVWSEKDAIIGSIEEITNELGVTVRVGRGFNSATVSNDIAGLFAKIEKPIRVFYLGDHDPSGRCIEKEMYERLLRYGSGHFKMERIAIHARDITRFNLPPLRIKDKDPRQHSFRQRFGEDCVELDALPVTVLRQRVREAIEKQMEPVAWKRAIEVEQVEQVSIRSLLSNWPTHLRENQPGKQL